MSEKFVNNKIKSSGILIVDDDVDYCTTICQVLTSQGYTNFTTATRSAEALSILSARGEDIYLVLLDLKIDKEMSGIDIVKHMLNIHKFHVGIVMITAWGTGVYADEFLKLGSEYVATIEFMPKSSYYSYLLHEIEEALILIHKKRLGYLYMSAESLLQRMDSIGLKLDQISSKQFGFLHQLGLDIVRIILIAAAVVGLLHFGIGDLIRRIIGK